MQRDGEQRFSYALSGVTSDYRYKISGGGTWTSRIHDSHGAAADRRRRSHLDSACRAYMRLEDRSPVADDVHRIEAPIDSHLVLAATVSGDVARGEIVLLKRSVCHPADQVQDEEHAWFDDDLPADAETDTPWHWSTARAYTGSEIVHLPAAAISRLASPPGSTSAARAGRGIVLSDGLARSRRSARPHHLAACGTRIRRAALMGRKSTPASGQPPAGPSRPSAAAERVGPGWKCRPTRWERSPRRQAPRHDAGDRPRPGLLDRPGYLTRSSRPVETVPCRNGRHTCRCTASERSGRWLGEVPVAVDRLLTRRRCEGLGGQASAIAGAAGTDAAEDDLLRSWSKSRGLDVVLPAVQPLPISGRAALDDWGMAAVGIQLGPWKPR